MGEMGRKLDLGRQIHADVYASLCCVERAEMDRAPLERLMEISSLAGALNAALVRVFPSRPDADGGSEIDPASGAHTAHNEGSSRADR